MSSDNALLDAVALRPTFIPSHVLSKVDTTAAPTRLIAVDKTTLPAGASVDTASGDVSVPLAVAVSSIAGVTKNLAAFTNAGQFSLSGSSLVIKPSLIVQPAVGVVDAYVLTLNNQGGGTTLVTVSVSHGSVKIDSISVASGDVTPPVTTAAPAVSGTSDTGTTLSVTINEAGTGYYLVLPAASAAPTVAAVQAGTSFVMTANVAATPAITGLTASTAYKIYFVAKDAAGNVQATVQNVAVSTTATPDVTAPVTTAAPSVSATTVTGTTLSVTINEAGTGYYLVLPAASAAPSVATVQAGTAFAMTANVAATPAITGLTASTAYKIYFVAKDAANNVQAAVQSVAVTTTGLPAGYIFQGGLTWMPVTVFDTWTNANAYCANTAINGQTGWRMPTKDELLSLYNSGTLSGAQGWTLSRTWSSTANGAGDHYYFYLDYGDDYYDAYSTYDAYVSCVR